MPIRVSLTANCDSSIFYKRELYDGSGDPDFIEVINPAVDIYIDRDTTLRYYAVPEGGEPQDEQIAIYEFPPKFRGLLYIHSGDEAITLQWDPAWDADGPINYRIYNPSGGSPIPMLDPIALTTATSFTVTDAHMELNNGTSQCFVVRAVDDIGMEDQNYGQYCLAPQPVFYVDVAAGDGGDGSKATPYNSIQDANDAMTRWFTSIWVAGGTYEETLDFTLNDPPYVGDHIHAAQIFGGFDSTDWTRKVKSQPTFVDGGGANITWLAGEWDLIDGFRITNGANGIYLDNRMSVTIRNCVFQDNSSYGLVIHGEDVFAGPSIVGSIFALNQNGIKLQAKADPDSESGVIPLIRNNIIYLNTGSGIVAETIGGGVNTVYMLGSIHNNIIAVNSGTGLAASVTGGNFYMVLDVFNDYIGSNGTDLSCTGCDNSNLDLMFCDILNPGPYTGFAIISEPPLFTNPPVDFHLQPLSPLVDAGLPDSLFDDTDGSRNDIGAFGGVGGNWKPLPFPD